MAAREDAPSDGSDNEVESEEISSKTLDISDTSGQHAHDLSDEA